jgi:DNA-binding MurR/RpiR family transcriptional regulator
MESMFTHYFQAGAHPVTAKLEAVLPQLSRSEARIARYVIDNIADIGFETGVTLARRLAVSEITVSRFLRKAGYKGMAALKRELQAEQEIHQFEPQLPRGTDEINLSLRGARDQEIKAISRLFEQFETPDWAALVAAASEAGEIYVTGFQSVRGSAEDFARRLSLARDNVRFISANDGMLGEWLTYHGDANPKPVTLIVIDVVPHAQAGAKIAQIAKDFGFTVIVISDEFCDWAHGIADHSIYAKSRSGLFLGSTVPLMLTLDVLVDFVARAGPGYGRNRFESWQLMTRRMDIF